MHVHPITQNQTSSSTAIVDEVAQFSTQRGWGQARNRAQNFHARAQGADRAVRSSQDFWKVVHLKNNYNSRRLELSSLFFFYRAVV